MKFKERFSSQDLDTIKSTVRAVEKNVSGEIVPVFVERSDKYAITQYKSAVLFSAFAFLVVIVLDRYVPAMAVYDPIFIFLIILMAGFVGAILPELVSFYKRALISQTTMDHACMQKAETLFLEEEIFSTRQRTGIMIFISFFEQEVIIMADRGISKVVDQQHWDKIVAELIVAMKTNQAINGTVNAINQCGEILLKKGFKKTQDDINELSDNLRID